MALSSAVGSFAMNTGTGNQSVTGLAFQPKAVIFFSAASCTAAGFTNDVNIFLGFAVSSSQRGVAACFKDQTSFSVGKRIAATRCIMATQNSGSELWAADFVSMNSDGFTFNVAVAPASAFVVCYLALGGADLTNAAVGSFTFATATGNQPVTGVGFTPDLLLFAHTGTTGALPVGGSEAYFSMSAANASAQAGCLLHRELNADPTSVGQACFGGTAMITGGATAIDGQASLSTMDADGFTLNWTDASPSAFNCVYLALKGGRNFISTETQKTSAGTQASTGVGFTPKALFLFGGNHTATSSIITDLARTSIGASDGTNERTVWIGGQDNRTPGSATIEQQRLSTTKVFQHASEPASTVEAEADLNSFDADGMTLNWSSADATARLFNFMAFGDSPAAGGGGSGPTNLMMMGVG